MQLKTMKSLESYAMLNLAHIASYVLISRVSYKVVQAEFNHQFIASLGPKENEIYAYLLNIFNAVVILCLFGLPVSVRITESWPYCPRRVV